jgi:hypothetical protein
MRVAVKATEFCRNFGDYQRKVQTQAIEVVNHGSVTGYFVSPEEYGLYQRLIVENRVALDPSELPAHLRQAIAEAKVDSRYDHLNALMKDD